MSAGFTRARAFAAGALLIAGCTEDGDEAVGHAAQAFESADAVLYDFALDGVVTTRSNDPTTVRRRIETQLFYSVGQLNGERSVGRHLSLSISDIAIAPSAPGTFKVTYRARLPVAWGKAAPPAAKYELVLPLSVEADDQSRFTEKYAAKCSDPEGGITSAADAGRMFLFYRPQRAGCALASTDVARVVATTSRSTENTEGKYPEYDRVWEDGTLEVVAVFGVENEDSPADAGARAYERFVRGAASDLGVALDSTPPKRRVDFAAKRADGKRVHIKATLLGKSLTADATGFDAWFDAATPRADLVFYSGHAGLGANVRALTSKGSFVANQYQIWFISGCDTLAYVDRTLAERRAVLNPDDPSGTRNLDVVANALGSWFSAGDAAALSFVRALTGAPRTYRSILDEVDPDQVSAVFGEEDNLFVPGAPTAPGAPGAPTAFGPEPAVPTAAPQTDRLMLAPGAIAEMPIAESDSRGCNASSRGGMGAHWVVLMLLMLLAKRRADATEPSSHPRQ